jgi:hypothetical protein
VNKTADIFSGEFHDNRDGFTFDNDIGKEEWITPRYILDALGEFDLDPCSPTEDRRPYPTAKKHLTIFDNGLNQNWHGRVWCNPPYGREAIKFMKKMADHNNGIALTFARTETRMFQQEVFGKASGIFFIAKRINFCDYKGKPSENSAGAPSVLISYGNENADILKNCKLNGFYVRLL